MRINESRNSTASFSVCRSISHASDDLSDCSIRAGVFDLPLSFAETYSLSSEICGSDPGSTGNSLCISNVEILSES